MEPSEAIGQIRKSCDVIAQELMRLHPATAGLPDKAARDEIIRALFELTRQVESIKKLTRKVESKLSDPNADEPPPVL